MEEDEPIRISVTDVFDLHSVPPRDVAAVVDAYLDEAHEMGFTALRIVHGKGIGVQREAVRKVLARKPYVTAFRDAPAEAGSWGATIVDLAHPSLSGGN
jgi:dsDNA-specific endonuclease/ATPase MutS2